MINKEYTYAVIGASNNTEKYGYKVFKDLQENGYNVIPVNPNENKPILGSQVYSNINDYKDNIDIAIFVVPPQVTEKILQTDIIKKGIQKVRLQPGAENETAIQFCENNNIECTHNACIMIQRTK